MRSSRDEAQVCLESWPPTPIAYGSFAVRFKSTVIAADRTGGS